MKYLQQIEQGKRVTKESILEALHGGDWDVLYYAKEMQITNLIDQGKIDEDFDIQFHNYQEEYRCMMADAREEFK